jgi:hypothetical protein
VEVNFNQACNFKCIYCSPHLSTEWEEEIKKFGAFELTDRVHNNLEALTQSGLMPLRVANRDNPYVKAFWEWWPTVYPNLRVFRMTGGEPLMDSNTWKVLDYALENPNADLELSITSNLCPPKPELFDKFIGKAQDLEKIQIWEDPAKFNHYSGNHWYVSPAIKYFMLFVSCDSVGPQAEYIRTGLDIAVWEKNLDTYLSNTQLPITFMITFNILTVTNFQSLLEKILEWRRKYNTTGKTQPGKWQRIRFDTPYLKEPLQYDMNLLPKDEFMPYMHDHLQFIKDNIDNDDRCKFSDLEYEKFRRVVDYMATTNYSPDRIAEGRKDFYKWFSEHDRRRDTNFLKTFPELQNFYLQCKDLHE